MTPSEWITRAYRSTVRSRTDRVVLVVLTVALGSWALFALWFYLGYRS